MARRSASAPPEDPVVAAVADAGTLFDGWIQSQQRLLDTMLGQWAGWQDITLQSWNRQLDAWGEVMRPDGAARTTPGQVTWFDLPLAYLAVSQRAAQAWWGPIEPFLARGGEQLA